MLAGTFVWETGEQCSYAFPLLLAMLVTFSKLHMIFKTQLPQVRRELI